MAIDFPASPTLNDTFSSGGVTYTWDGTVWVASGSAAFVQKSGDTITGNLTLNADLTVDTDTLYADSTNNNVGVGTTSPGSYNGSANQLVVSNSADDCGITINSDAASTGNIFFADGTSGSAVAEGYVKYNHSVNNLRFGANGSERMRIDSTGNVGIGTTSPGRPLQVAMSTAGATVASLVNTGGSGAQIGFQSSSLGNDATVRAGAEGTAFAVYTNNSRAVDIDSSGRLLVGTSTSRAVSNQENRLQLFGTNQASGRMAIIRSSNDAGGSGIHLCKSRGTAGDVVVNDDDQVGIIVFNGHDGGDFQRQCAYIQVNVDGTPGTDEIPGRITFGTTADGANAPTERMRIDSNGDVTISNDLAVNTDTLYVDTVNDRVGIGTASPSEALDIQGGLLINGANVTAVLSGSIADDAFYSLDLTAAGFMLGGLATITTFSTYDNFPQPVGSGMFYYDCGNSLSGARILADADATTPINGGTTSTSTTITDFTDNRITIICNSNTLRIANRIGSARRFKLTFL